METPALSQVRIAQKNQHPTRLWQVFQSEPERREGRKEHLLALLSAYTVKSESSRHPWVTQTEKGTSTDMTSWLQQTGQLEFCDW